MVGQAARLCFTTNQSGDDTEMLKAKVAGSLPMPVSCLLDYEMAEVRLSVRTGRELI
jgi:hypothetical protein